MKKQVKFLITLAVVTFLLVLQMSPGVAKITADHFRCEKWADVDATISVFRLEEEAIAFI